MKATRRTFFGLLGTTPIAAKAAADQAIGRLAGFSRLDGLGDFSTGLGRGGGEVVEMPGANPVPGLPYETRADRALEYLKFTGLPAWFEEELRDDAKEVRQLDPDLAALRSWSMAVKIQEQRQRNFAQRVANLGVYAQNRRGQTLVEKLLGFRWPF